MTVDTTSACSALNCTGFTGTVTGSSQLTISGNWTLASTTAWSHSGLLVLGASSTAGAWSMGTSRTLTGDLDVAGTGAKTLSGGTLAVNGMMRWTGTCNFTTPDNSIVQCKGGWTGGTTAYSMQYFNDQVGNPAFYLQGGVISGTMPNTVTGCYIDGTLTSVPNMTNSSISFREGLVLKYNSGTWDLTDTIIYMISWSGDIQVGSNILFNVLDWRSGAATQTADVYTDYWSTNIPAITINGAYKIYVNKGIAVRSGGYINGDIEFVVKDTATIFVNNSYYSGSSPYAGLLTVNVPVTIDASGKTVTIDPRSGDLLSWGGGAKLKLTNGSIVTTSCNWGVATGGYNFDIDTAINTLDITTTGVTATLLSDFDCATYREIAGSTLSIADTKTFTIGTNIYSNGTDATTTTISSAGTGYLDYSGTMANQKIFKTTLTNIDASSSAVPIYTWYGAATGCTNVKVVTGDNIKQTIGFACIS